MNNEQYNQIIDEAYENYKTKTEIMMGHGFHGTLLSKEEFINKCKTDTEFSERWGLKIDESDEKLLLSDVNCSYISRDDINKQAYLVMSNINATKIITNISDSNHETLMNSFFTLQDMFNEYLKQNGVE
jgi:hypothetical protein